MAPVREQPTMCDAPWACSNWMIACPAAPTPEITILTLGRA
jgi:hypothetical protein